MRVGFDPLAKCVNHAFSVLEGQETSVARAVFATKGPESGHNIDRKGAAMKLLRQGWFGGKADDGSLLIRFLGGGTVKIGPPWIGIVADDGVAVATSPLGHDTDEAAAYYAMRLVERRHCHLGWRQGDGGVA